MRFIGLRENIIQSVLTCARFSNPRGNLPILSNLFLKSQKTGLMVKATNLESGVEAVVRGVCEDDGEFTVNAKLLSEYLLSIPEEKIDLRVDGRTLVISAGNYQTTMNGIEATDFPILPGVEGGVEFRVETGGFARALSKTIFTISPQEMRQELSGAQLHLQNNALTVAATDSFRLAEQKISCQGGGEKRVIIPLKTLQEIQKICDTSPEKSVDIILGEGGIEFRVGMFTVFSRLIEGQYPDYQAIIPTKIQTTVLVKTNDLLQAIKASGLFSQTGLYDVRLSANSGKGTLTLSSQASDVGKSTSALDGSVSGEDVDIVLNFRYLLDGLSRIDEEETELLISSGDQPMRVRGKGDNGYLYLVMPIRQ